MPLSQAVELIFRSTEIMKGGEVFVLKMKSVGLRDLAEGLADEYNLNNGGSRKKIEISVIGRRAGEKMHEELLVEEESYRISEQKEMLVIMPASNPVNQDDNKTILAKSKKINPSAHSSNYKPMSKTQLRNFLRENKLF